MLLFKCGPLSSWYGWS